MKGRIEHNSDVRQFVCFMLAKETFCVDIYHIKEINRMVEITKIPQSSEFVEGIINLRGQITPIIDLRKRFGLENRDTQDKEQRIIVVESNEIVVGFIVDQVTEVLRIQASNIEPTPEIVSSNVDIRYIEGVAQVDEQLLIILNTDRIFSDEEKDSLASVTIESQAN